MFLWHLVRLLRLFKYYKLGQMYPHPPWGDFQQPNTVSDIIRSLWIRSNTSQVSLPAEWLNLNHHNHPETSSDFQLKFSRQKGNWNQKCLKIERFGDLHTDFCLTTGTRRTNLLLGLIFKLLDVEIRADSSPLRCILWYCNNCISVLQSFFLDFSHNKLVWWGGRVCVH